MLRQASSVPQSSKLPAQCTAGGKGTRGRLDCSGHAINALDLTGHGVQGV